MMEVLDWADTLLGYLRSSNEDEQVVRFVGTKILPRLVGTFEKINWLEIGPGPGTKTLPIAETLTRMARAGIGTLRLISRHQHGVSSFAATTQTCST